MIIKIARISFWCSVTMGILSVFITFCPGAECPWFIVAAILAVPGFLVPRRTFRYVSTGMLLLWSMAAFSGYLRGKEHQQWLNEIPEGVTRRFNRRMRLRRMEPDNVGTPQAPQNKVLENTDTNAPDSQH